MAPEVRSAGACGRSSLTPPPLCHARTTWAGCVSFCRSIYDIVPSSFFFPPWPGALAGSRLSPCHSIFHHLGISSGQCAKLIGVFPISCRGPFIVRHSRSLVRSNRGK